jgi:tetratricopeptide (TPR) repeat protein
VARAIGAGFDRLGADARRLFLGLSLLPLRSFGLWTATALLPEADLDPAAALSELAASNIVEPVESEVRYRFHDLTREYAIRRARAEYADKSDRDAMSALVYRALLSLTRRAHAGLYGGEFDVINSAVPGWDAPSAVLAEVSRSPREWFEKERLNVRAAVSHCAELGLTDICWDLAMSAHEFYTVGEYFDDWYATHTVALQACRDAGNIRGEGMMLTGLGQPALAASRPASEVSGPAELQRAVDLLTQCGDQHGQAIALRTLANALRRGGQLARPLWLFGEALARYQAGGDTVGQWQTLRYIGQTHLDLGDHGQALSVLRNAESIAAGLGDQRLLAQTKYWIGQTCLAVDDLAGAEAAFTDVLETYREPTSPGHAYAVHGLGDVALQTGALEEAERYFALAGDQARHGADAVLQGRVYLSVAALHAALGQAGQQVTALEDAAECLAECGAAYLEAQALSLLSQAQAGLGNGVASRAARTRADDVYTAMGLPDEDRLHRKPPGWPGDPDPD